MRFTVDITLEQVQTQKMLNEFKVEYFTNQKEDLNYHKFLNFLSAHETYLEEGIQINYHGVISVNGISKKVDKEFLNELYDVLE